ncbi:MAG: pyridoxamine 5'-phosphate oxidase family protein [Spirochaetales bacterium]|nr:pyridoxamine 5'-phosphate oxidase family protein [Spirochaetales bacterium]
MSKMSNEVLDAISKTMPTCLATASADGNPNLVYVTYIKALDGDTLVVADNKFEKTRENLDSNPVMSVVVLDPDTRKAYQLKCKAETVTEGKKYDDVVEWVHVNHPQMTPKAGVYLTVDEVYCGADKLA